MKILLIGGCGYAGSALYPYLINKGHDVESVDLEWYGNYTGLLNEKIDYKWLDKYTIIQCDVVIVLAGLSSVKSCENNLGGALTNNVNNLVRLASRMGKHQKLIVASSSSVYGGLSLMNATEEICEYKGVNEYDVSKIIIDQLLPLIDINYYSLRFGTLGGASSNLRTDIIPNAFVSSYMDKGYIEVFNGYLNRSMLGLKDLCEAINLIINKPDNGELKGIYNLASFSDTIENVGKRVSEVLECEVKYVTKPGHIYDFSINCDKIKKTFGFEPRETVESMTRDLIYYWHSMNKGNRNSRVEYD